MDIESLRVRLSDQWCNYLREQPESGMSYQIVTVILHDGRRFERVPFVGPWLCLEDLPGYWKAPFAETDIESILVTHNRSGPPRQVTSGH